MSILGTLPPCSFPGCEDMSCEDYCAKDEYCGKYFGAGEAPRDKKCIECNKCKDIEVVTKPGGKFTHSSIPFLFIL